MKLKSITFRCSEAQMSRLESAMNTLECDNRTAVLSDALETFLRFTEQEDIAGLNLFELVSRIDAEGSALEFASQA
ncbi:MAG: hypothetical protein IJA81_05500 [Akkermansia sp.]|nr:hypothetical protein [Akkermansia sp.]MBR3695419.1 hypothetical protein [Akkermansia sp.]MBR3944416.1 hypothetical protein [Akkermansia sp.]